MPIIFPPNIDTPVKKLRFALRAEERLRMIYNIISYWRRVGLTKDQYDNGIEASLIGGKGGLVGQRFKLPALVKVTFPDFATPPTIKQASAVKYILMLRMRKYSEYSARRLETDKADVTFDSDIDDDAN